MHQRSCTQGRLPQDLFRSISIRYQTEREIAIAPAPNNASLRPAHGNIITNNEELDPIAFVLSSMLGDILFLRKTEVKDVPGVVPGLNGG